MASACGNSSAGGIALIVLAVRTRHEWEVDYHGHSVLFENGFLTSGRLMLDGEIVATGKVGRRGELSARIASGSSTGDRIVAMTDAGLLSLRCRILARSEESFTSTPAE